MNRKPFYINAIKGHYFTLLNCEAKSIIAGDISDPLPAINRFYSSYNDKGYKNSDPMPAIPSIINLFFW